MPTLKSLYEEFLSDCRYNNLAPATIRWYEYMLRMFVEIHDEEDMADIKRRDIKHFLHMRNDDGLATASVRGHLRGIRRFFKWAVDERYLEYSPADYVKPPKKKPEEEKIKAISMTNVERLLMVCQGKEPIDRRDRAVILILIDTAARAGGLIGLEIEDVDCKRAAMYLLEKDGPRSMPLSPYTVNAIQAYLAVRPDRPTPKLLVSMTHDHELSYWGLRLMLIRRADCAGIAEDDPVNPHAFRHAFAREFLKNGGDTSMLADLMGHSDPAITRKHYAQFAVEELRRPHMLFTPVRQLAEKQL